MQPLKGCWAPSHRNHISVPGKKCILFLIMALKSLNTHTKSFFTFILILLNLSSYQSNMMRFKMESLSPTSLTPFLLCLFFFPSLRLVSPFLPLCFLPSLFPLVSFLTRFEWWESMLFHSKVLHANTSLYSAFIVIFGNKYQPSQLGEQVLSYRCPIYLHF